jgi:signal transduction histidine kinase
MKFEKGRDLKWLDRVEESAKRLLSGTKDFIWALDPANNDLSDLFLHIKDFGEKVFLEKKIEFHAETAVMEPLPLPDGFSREVNLIFKEAITNAFKYSGASLVQFTLKKENTRVEFSLIDNGAGISSELLEHPSGGLRNMKYRAEKIFGTLTIAKMDNGTQINLQFSLTSLRNTPNP